jgi:hypothetical protein
VSACGPDVQVSDMEGELRTLPPAQRRGLSDKVARYRADIQALRAQLDRAVATSSRDELLSGGRPKSSMVDQDTHARAVHAASEAKRCDTTAVTRAATLRTTCAADCRWWCCVMCSLALNLTLTL